MMQDIVLIKKTFFRYDISIKQDIQCTSNRKIEVHLRNHCCGAKERSTAYSVHVSVVLGIQHAKHTCHIILSSADCPAVPYFFTLSHKPHNF